jgi:hypothetical protein
MNNHNFIVYIVVAFVLLFSLRIYYESDAFNLKCVISTRDGNKYCVRERAKLTDAADLLAKVAAKCKRMVAYMNKHHPNDERTIRLVKGFNPKKICETLPTSEMTAYSENKGEKIAFCLNKSKDGPKLIDINTLMFVALHELSHIMTSSIGHKRDFWENFKFLLENAKRANIYHPVDYKSNPQEYCGTQITDNPYYDLN